MSKNDCGVSKSGPGYKEYIGQKKGCQTTVGDKVGQVDLNECHVKNTIRSSSNINKNVSNVKIMQIVKWFGSAWK